MLTRHLPPIRSARRGVDGYAGTMESAEVEPGKFRMGERGMIHHGDL